LVVEALTIVLDALKPFLVSQYVEADVGAQDHIIDDALQLDLRIAREGAVRVKEDCLDKLAELAQKKDDIVVHNSLGIIKGEDANPAHPDVERFGRVARPPGYG